MFALTGSTWSPNFPTTPGAYQTDRPGFDLFVTKLKPGNDTLAPTPPANLRITNQTPTTVTLAWDAATDDVGIVAYDVYSGTLLLTTTTAVQATLLGLVPGVLTRVTVTARDAAGNNSRPGGPLDVDIGTSAYQVYLPLTRREQPVMPVTAPAGAQYVPLAWETLERSAFDPRESVPRAYNEGYNAYVGDPVSNIIIDFGRQVDPVREDGCLPANMWGVQLIRQETADTTGCKGIRSEAWVASIARNYILGYYANPNHTRLSFIGIATNNGNYPWACSDVRWFEAGRVWRDFIEDMAVFAKPYEEKVRVRSAIDVESWFREYDASPEYPNGWIACGDATQAWFDGFEEREGQRAIMNFGSNAFVEYKAAWTREQVYDVFDRRGLTLAYPQIYCGSDIPGEVGHRAIAWAEYLQYYPEMYFAGVTSENATNSRCPNETLTWDAAWQELNTAVITAGFPNRLGRSVISFYLP